MKKFLLILAIPAWAMAGSIDDYLSDHPILTENKIVRYTVTKLAESKARLDNVDTSDIGSYQKKGAAAIKSNGEMYADLAVRELANRCERKIASKTDNLKDNECEIIRAVSDGKDNIQFATMLSSIFEPDIKKALRTTKSAKLEPLACSDFPDYARCVTSFSGEKKGGGRASFSMEIRVANNGNFIVLSSVEDGERKVVKKIVNGKEQ